MAVTVVEGRNPYSTAGSLLTLGGALIPGASILTPLGMGMSAIGGGGLNNVQAGSTLGQILGNIINGGWKNPASGSLGEMPNDDELARKWGGYKPWQR